MALDTTPPALLASAVLVVAFGRLGDMYGQVRIYNLGFAVFTAGSLASGWIRSPAATAHSG